MDRIIKSDCLTRENILKPHYFPDISIEYPPNNIKTEKESGFQSIGFGEVKKQSSDPPKVFKESVKKESVKSVEEIKQNARDVEKQAYIQGFAKGEKAGIKSGESKFKPVLNNFRQALLELEKVRKKICLDAEKMTVNLALEIAKKIVSHEIATNKEVVLNVVKKAVKKVVDHGRIIIKTSPSDFEFIENSNPEFLNFVDNAENITFEKDGTIPDGGCVLETDFGNIDARIEKQFQVVEEAFKYQGLIRGTIPEKRKTVSGSGRGI